MYMKEGLFIMKMNVLSVKETEFTDKQTNQVRKMWQVFLPDETGAVGYIYSTEPVKTGDSVDVRIIANRNGRFAAKIIHPKNA